MIFTIIGILLIIYSFKNFKKAFLWFLIFKLFLVTNITVVAVPGLPLFTLELFLTMIFFIQFYRIRKNVSEKVEFPYKRPMTFVLISWGLSTIFAYIGFIGAFSQFLKDVFQQIIFIWMLWELIDVKKDLAFILKWFTVAFFFICIYGLYEHKIQSNPLVEYEASLIGDIDRAIDWTYDADVERGYRTQSVFEHAIGAGVNWALYIVFILSLYINYKYPIKYKKLTFLTVLLSFMCLFFTNSRGPIVFLIFSGASLINIKNLRGYIFIIGVVISIVILLPYLSEYIDNIVSIFDSKVQEQVGGSNAEMRFMQMSAALELMKESPIVGWGFKFMNVLNNSLTTALLGLESMWIRIMVQFGIIGIIANVYYAYYSLIKIPKLFHSKSVFYISLAYWVTASLTSVPGMLYYLYFLILIIFIKFSPTYMKMTRAYGK